MTSAIVDIRTAIFTGVAGNTIARVIRRMIDATSSILTRVEIFGTERYFVFAEFTLCKMSARVVNYAL